MLLNLSLGRHSDDLGLSKNQFCSVLLQQIINFELSACWLAAGKCHCIMTWLDLCKLHTIDDIEIACICHCQALAMNLQFFSSQNSLFFFTNYKTASQPQTEWEFHDLSLDCDHSRMLQSNPWLCHQILAKWLNDFCAIIELVNNTASWSVHVHLHVNVQHQELDAGMQEILWDSSMDISIVLFMEGKVTIKVCHPVHLHCPCQWRKEVYLLLASK